MKGPGTRAERYVGWWLDDLPRMNGPLRFTFYSGLFVLAHLHWKPPLLGIGFYEATDPALFRPYGLMELLGVPHVPADVQALVKEKAAAIKAGTFHPFTGPIKDQTGKVRVPAGKSMTNGELAGMNWYVMGIKGSLPK